MARPSQTPKTDQLLRRKSYKEIRPREYLLPAEVERLIQTARGNRWGTRDATLIMLSYRHGLRVGETVALMWSQIDLQLAHIHVNRIKNGTPTVQPLRGPELRSLKQLKRETPDEKRSAYVFLSERGGPLTTRAVHRILADTGEKAGFEFPIHPHMLRHACGFYLANQGHDTRAIQDYLGHREIQHTVRYTQLAPQRFNKFWDD